MKDLHDVALSVAKKKAISLPTPTARVADPYSFDTDPDPAF
jgi:hypothetical protein